MVVSSPQSAPSQHCDCADKVRLVDEYSSAVAELSRLANVLNARISSLDSADYELLFERVEYARVASDSAYRALTGHTQQHHC